MTPPIESWPASQLPYRVQITNQGRRRKKPVDLSRCGLEELIQYNCWLEASKQLDKPTIKCEQIVRLFRRCEGDLMVETTAIEGLDVRAISLR